MDDDRRLLRRFVEDHSQAAFAALTARYLSLVYSTCRRELSDADLAEDVTQAVFLILARKAPSLRREVVLSGWLFQTARFAARNARLQEQRRKATEQKAADTVREQQMETEDAAWTDIEPLLNQSLSGLREAERECILLRFFQGMSFAETGTALGLSEEAARKRVTRSLEKMRQFFVKNGVIVPSTALAVLLMAHAVKAAPIGIAPAVAQSTAGVLAGHINAGLTSPHVHQITEGVMKAMKMIKIKTAVGLTAAVVLGMSVYAVAHGMALARTSIHQIASLNAVPKPGHILQQVPGQTLTAAQIAERCKNAYAALTSYQVTSSVVSQSITAADSQAHTWNTSATIRFVRPGKIHAEGTDMSGQPFAYVSDGVGTEETDETQKGRWEKENSEMAIASVTGIAQSAATTIPALLLNTRGGGAPLPRTVGKTLSPEVTEDTLNGQACYVLTAHLETPELAEITSLWIDEKTYLVRRSVTDANDAPRTFQVSGKTYSMPATKDHNDEHFTNERLNEAIPDSTFALPPIQ